MDTYLNDLEAADSFQACDLAGAVLDIEASKTLNFGQYFVALQVGKLAAQHILDQMIWISLQVQLQCHLHWNHQQDLRFHSYITLFRNFFIILGKNSFSCSSPYL